MNSFPQEASRPRHKDGCFFNVLKDMYEGLTFKLKRDYYIIMVGIVEVSY